MADPPPQHMGPDPDGAAALAATLRAAKIEQATVPATDAEAAGTPPRATAADTSEPPSVATAPSRVGDQIPPGTMLGDRYEVREHLGAGGMGTVYAAFDRLLEVQVALKFVRPARALDPREQDRLRREVRVAQAITHPNVIRTFTLEEHDGHFFIVMELLDGASLADRLRAGLPPLDEVRRVVRGVLDGLAAAHGKNIVHRDIKPANIRIGGDGRVVLMDFGIARVSDLEPAIPAGRPLHLITAGPRTILAGTPGYIAPEVLAGEPPTTASDLYAVGVLVHQMLVGRLPADRTRTGTGAEPTMPSEATADTTSTATAAPLDGLDAAAIPPRLAAVVRRLLAPSPAARFASASDVMRALEAAMEPEAILPAGRRRRGWLGAAVVAATVAVAAGAWSLRRPTTPVPTPVLQRGATREAIAPAPPVDTAAHAIAPAIPASAIPAPAIPAPRPVDQRRKAVRQPPRARGSEHRPPPPEPATIESAPTPADDAAEKRRRMLEFKED